MMSPLDTKVLALSVVTDECFPDCLRPADVAKIIKTANDAEPALSRLVVEFLRGADAI